jgi:hypothetical protein
MLIPVRLLRPTRNRSPEALETARERKRRYYREFIDDRERHVEIDDAGAVVSVGQWVKRTTTIPPYLLR